MTSKVSKSQLPSTCSSAGQAADCTCSIETQIENVSSYLNDKVHTLAKSLIISYKNDPYQYTTFDITSYRKSIDPVLLYFIEQLTQSLCTKRRKFFQAEAGTRETKQVRQLYILYLVLFCTNTVCFTLYLQKLLSAMVAHRSL